MATGDHDPRVLAERVDQRIRFAALDLIDGLGRGRENIQRDMRYFGLEYGDQAAHERRGRVVGDQHPEQTLECRDIRRRWPAEVESP